MKRNIISCDRCGVVRPERVEPQHEDSLSIKEWAVLLADVNPELSEWRSVTTAIPLTCSVFGLAETDKQLDLCGPCVSAFDKFLATGVVIPDTAEGLER